MTNAGADGGLEALYNAAFYDANERSSFRSADVVLALVFDCIKPCRVLDVGCGTGVWLSVALAHGATDVAGIDGEHIDRDLLRIDRDRYAAADLADDESLRTAIDGRTFDMTMCLETAEHLDAGSAPTFVAALAATADIVLWSAARPGQGGTHHVNEREPDYWASLWHGNGFAVLDLIRPALQNSTIDIWYRQNCLVFVRRAQARRVAAAFHRHYRRHWGYVPPLGFVHPQIVAQHESASQLEVSDALSSISPVVLDALGPGFETDESRHEGHLTMVAFRERTGDVVPQLLMFSPFRTSVAIGLYFPAWRGDARAQRATEARARRRRMTWDAPSSRQLEGWIEMGKPGMYAGSSISILDQRPTAGAIRSIAVHGASLWRSYAGDGHGQRP